MPWLLASPAHQHPWYWLNIVGRPLSTLKADFSNLFNVSVEKWYELTETVYVSSEKFTRTAHSKSVTNDQLCHRTTAICHSYELTDLLRYIMQLFTMYRQIWYRYSIWPWIRVSFWKVSPNTTTLHVLEATGIVGFYDICVYRSEQNNHQWPLLLTRFNLIPAWVSNDMPSKLLDEITYPFLNFNGCTVEV